MKKINKKRNILPLYKTKDNKIISYGWRSSPPFITKVAIKEYSLKVSEENFYEDENTGKFLES